MEQARYVFIHVNWWSIWKERLWWCMGRKIRQNVYCSLLYFWPRFPLMLNAQYILECWIHNNVLWENCSHSLNKIYNISILIPRQKICLMMSMLHAIQNMKTKKKHGGHCGKSVDVLEGIGRLKLKDGITFLFIASSFKFFSQVSLTKLVTLWELSKPYFTIIQMKIYYCKYNACCQHLHLILTQTRCLT